MPLKVEEEPDRLDGTLIEEMTQSQESIFVVRVTSVPHHIFTSDVLESKWKGVIGRLVIIDDSKMRENQAQQWFTLCIRALQKPWRSSM